MIDVLIVDDSASIRERLAVLLIETGQIRIAGQAGNSGDGWKAVQRLKPDTVLLDIRMPDNSGIALLKNIKAHYPETTVIMLTNYDDPIYRAQCRRFGADYFLNKTLEFEEIADTITAHSAR